MLDAKRSNAINIGLTVLPPPRTIKAAILKMDNAIMNREGIEVRHGIYYMLLASASKLKMNVKFFKMLCEKAFIE